MIASCAALLIAVQAPQGLATPEDVAVARGCAFLAQTQAKDGAWGVVAPVPQDAFFETALAALALLSDGGGLRAGCRHRLPLRRAIRYLQRHVPPRGPILVTQPRDRDWVHYETWYASISGLALAELQLREPTDRNHEVLQALQQRLLFLRRPTGAWCHDLSPRVRHLGGSTRAEYSEDLVAVTSLAVAALLHMERAGLSLSDDLRASFVRYYEATLNTDGGVQYGLQHSWDRATESEVGRTAGALLVLPALLGAADSRCAAAARYVSQRALQIPRSAGHGGTVFSISYLAGMLGAYSHSQRLGSQVDEALTPELLDRQRADGRFILNRDLWATPANCTAIAIIALRARKGSLSFARSPAHRATRFLLDARDPQSGLWVGSFGDRSVDIGLAGAGGLALSKRGETAAVSRVVESLEAALLTDDGERSHLNYQLPLALALLATEVPGKPSSDRIVARLARAQWPDGGWSYDGASGYLLLSTTAPILIALARARDSGTDVPDDVIRRGLDYVLGCQNPDGGMRYCVDPRHPILARDRKRYATSRSGTTLVALAALEAWHREHTEEFANAVRFLESCVAGMFDDAGENHSWYHVLWGASAITHLSDESQTQWCDALDAARSRWQEPDGGLRWHDMAWADTLTKKPCMRYFATAASLLATGW